MMFSSRFHLLLLSATFALGTFLTGCSSNDNNYALQYDVDDLDQRVSALEGAPSDEEPSPSSRIGTPPAGYKHVYMALPTGNEHTSSLLVEKMIPKEVIEGTMFDYYLRVTNLSNNLYLSDVVISDDLSNNFEYVSAEPAGNRSGDIVKWNLGTLAPDETQQITVRALVDQVGEAVACATVSYDPILCIDTIATRAVLAIKYNITEVATVCEQLTATVVVSNSGTGMAENVTVVCPLPDGLKTVEGNSQYTSQVGDLEPGAERTLTFQVESERAGRYDLESSASSSSLSSPVHSRTIYTTTHKPELNLTVEKSKLIYLGNSTRLLTTVSNNGTWPVDNVVVTADYPDCLELTSISGSGMDSGQSINWNLGTLAVNDSVDLLTEFKSVDKCDTEIRFIANGTCADQVADQVPVKVVGIPAILLEVIDITDPVRVGENTTYKIIALNQGTAEDNDIVIKCIVEEDVTIVSSGGATDGAISGKTVTFEPLSKLEPGSRAEWTVDVTIDQDGDHRFSVEMTTRELTRPVNETEATRGYSD